VSSRTVAVTRIRSRLLRLGFDLPEALYEKCPTHLVLAPPSSVPSPALSRMGILRTLDLAAYRLVMCGRVGCGIGEAAFTAALTLLDRADSSGDSRIPAMLVARSYTGNLRSWIEKELRLRYGLDRTDASEVAGFIFPIVDAAGTGVLAAGLADALESWRPGFVLLATQPVRTKAPSGILTVGDLAPFDAYAAVAELASADLAEIIAAAEAAGTGPPRSPLEVSVMARWYAAAAPAGSAGHSSLMSLWVDTVIHAAGLPRRSRTYLAFVARWLQVNKQSAFRTTDALPSTRRVRRWTPLLALAVAALTALIVGVLFGDVGIALVSAIFSGATVAHLLHPHSHGREGEFDTRLGWRSVVRSAGDIAAANLVFGLVLGVLAGVGWGLLTILRMLGPWLDFSLASLASNTWRPLVFPILAGSAIGLLMFIDSVLAFAIWNALERLRWAAKGASPLRLRAFLRAAESAGFVHEDADNFRFANSLIERQFAKAYLPLPMELEVTHPGFWTLLDRK
jgi:hypothetical protein